LEDYGSVRCKEGEPGTAIIRGNEVTTQNHSGGEAVLQDLSNRSTQPVPVRAAYFDGKRRLNFIGFAKQLNDIFTRSGEISNVFPNFAELST
jgi:hypothetical protein